MATTARPEVTGRAAGAELPLAITVKRASELSGLGLNSIWGFLRDGRLEAVRVPGVRRTLVSYPSLTRCSDLRPHQCHRLASEVGQAN
jgi:hypothetical protein